MSFSLTSYTGSFLPYVLQDSFFIIISITTYAFYENKRKELTCLGMKIGLRTEDKKSMNSKLLSFNTFDIGLCLNKVYFCEIPGSNGGECEDDCTPGMLRRVVW